MSKTEDKIQSDFFQYFWNKYPETRGLIFAVPNGGLRDKKTAGKLKATGVVPGIPDMLFCWKGETYFIEFKKPEFKTRKDGGTSQAQRNVHFALGHQGFIVYIFYSSDDAIEVVEGIINGTRE